MKPNLTKYSLQNKSVPKGSERDTNVSSKKVLSKGESGDRRAAAYTLERMKKSAE